MSLTGRLCIIGGGAMGSAIVRGVLAANVVPAASITVSDPGPEARAEFVRIHGITTVDVNRAAIVDAEMIVVAVKPQSMPAVLHELRGVVAPNQTILSVAAGVTLSAITNGLGHPHVVRAMPNTPAQIGAGVTVWIAAPSVDVERRQRVELVLGALGKAFEVTDENMLDMATALSGSGPGYVFLFLEALIDAGVHIGMTRALSSALAIETVIGTAKMARETGMHPAALRNMVTSPAGTTAAGVAELESGALRAVIDRAVMAAYARSRALGRGDADLK